REYGNDGERRRSPELSRGEHQILLELFPELRPAPISFDSALLLAQRVARSIHIAELTPRTFARLTLWYARLGQLRGDHVLVERELVVDLSIDLSSGATRKSKETAQSADAAHWR